MKYTNKTLMISMAAIMAVGAISMTYAATTFFGDDCTQFDPEHGVGKVCNDLNNLNDRVLALESIHDTTPNPDPVTHLLTTVTGAGSNPDCVAEDVCYDPSTLVVTLGDTVQMNNRDTSAHTFTSDGIFDSGILAASASFEWVADTTGELAYYCTLHPWMQGTITVETS